VLGFAATRFQTALRHVFSLIRQGPVSQTTIKRLRGPQLVEATAHLKKCFQTLPVLQRSRDEWLKKLNKLGDQGWEAVSLVHVETLGMGDPVEELFLKRPANEVNH
jgi:hypothetical protein